MIEQVLDNWPEILGVLAAAVLAFDRLAKLTPTTKDDGAVSALYRILAVLGAKVPDRPGGPKG